MRKIIIISLICLFVIMMFLAITKKKTKEITKSGICRGYLTDNEYLEHMIPHHQVAVDMSKVLLKNTKNDFMIYLANRIIRSQQEELILLNDMLGKKRYSYQSNLII